MPTFKDAINSQYDAELVITVLRQEVTNNRSRVRRTLRNRKTAGSGFWTNSGYPWSLSGGGSESGSYTYDYTDYSVKVIYEDEIWITHNADGSKTQTFSASVSMGGPLGGTGNPSGTVTLPTIPRATEPEVSGAVNAGSALTISCPRASSSFTHTLTYKFGSASGTIATGVGTSATWTVPLSLLNQIPDDVQGKGTITCKTYNGSTLIGTETVSFTVKAGSSIVPSFDSVSLSEAVLWIASEIGAYVQSQSRLAYSINGADGTYGSSITGYKLTVAGQTWTTRTGTTNAVKSSGTVPVVATVTDSRGRTASRTVNVTVLPWAAPKITLLRVQRSKPDGTLDDNGTSLKFTVAAAVSSLTVGSQKNQLRYQARVKQRGTSVWSSTAIATHTGITLSATFVVGTYSELLSWDARFEVSDRFTTSASQLVVSVGSVTLDIGPGGIGVGKRWEKGALDVAGDVYVERLRIRSTSDAFPEGGNPPLMIGDASALNLIIDTNEIMARNDGEVSGISINYDGGDVLLGNTGSTISLATTLRAYVSGNYNVLQSRQNASGGAYAHLILGTDSSSPLLRSVEIYNRTYTGSANMYVTSEGTLGRSTSLKEHKLDVESQEITDPLAILHITPRTWLDKGAVERAIADGYDDPARRVRAFGAVVEEVAPHAPYLVTTNADGAPDGLAYDRFGVALIPAMRWLVEQIADLRGEPAPAWTSAPEYDDADAWAALTKETP